MLFCLAVDDGADAEPEGDLEQGWAVIAGGRVLLIGMRASTSGGRVDALTDGGAEGGDGMSARGTGAHHHRRFLKAAFELAYLVESLDSAPEVLRLEEVRRASAAMGASATTLVCGLIAFFFFCLVVFVSLAQ